MISVILINYQIFKQLMLNNAFNEASLIRRHNSTATVIRTSSLECLDQARLQTCEPVSTHCSGRPVIVFQNRIRRSAVPPPLASSPCWCGDQAIALTAARCSEYVWTGLTPRVFQTNSLLSLPPEARCWWSGDHFRPQTYNMFQNLRQCPPIKIVLFLTIWTRN